MVTSRTVPKYLVGKTFSKSVISKYLTSLSWMENQQLELQNHVSKERTSNDSLCQQSS